LNKYITTAQDNNWLQTSLFTTVLAETGTISLKQTRQKNGKCNWLHFHSWIMYRL